MHRHNGIDYPESGVCPYCKLHEIIDKHRAYAQKLDEWVDSVNVIAVRSTQHLVETERRQAAEIEELKLKYQTLLDKYNRHRTVLAKILED